MISFIRVDDRLIHGQCQTKIIPMNSINRVIGIDDATAANPLLKKIFEMAAPGGVKVTVASFQDSLESVRKCMTNDKRTLIIARRPTTILKLYQEFPDLYKTLNIANIPQVGEGFLAHSDIWIDNEQLAAIKEMDKLGVEIYFQLFPGDSGGCVYWKNIKDNH